MAEKYCVFLSEPELAIACPDDCPLGKTTNQIVNLAPRGTPMDQRVEAGLQEAESQLLSRVRACLYWGSLSYLEK
ncbi:MAG: hypothetical protein Q8Q65_00340 [bacterium]|nr:hypothetical protein [bacterium]